MKKKQCNKQNRILKFLQDNKKKPETRNCNTRKVRNAKEEHIRVQNSHLNATRNFDEPLVFSSFYVLMP